MIEVLGGSYILAAHCKRVTLMDTNMIVLMRIRYKFSEFLDLVPLIDMKRFNILYIPLFGKKKNKVKIEEVFENHP